LGYLSGYIGFMAGIFLLLYWLFQPVALVNAGVAAYVPPEKTRLVPGPRKMDAPELVALEPLPRVEPSPLEALAKGSAGTATEARPVKREARKRIRRPSYEARAEVRESPRGLGWDRRRYDNRYRDDPRYRRYYPDRGQYWQGNAFWQQRW
jgi:hypothetical protein